MIQEKHFAKESFASETTQKLWDMGFSIISCVNIDSKYGKLIMFIIQFNPEYGDNTPEIKLNDNPEDVLSNPGHLFWV